MDKYINSPDILLKNLKKYFSHDDFKSKLQKDAIEAIVKGNMPIIH